MQRPMFVVCLLIVGSLGCKESKEQTEPSSLPRGSEGNVFEWMQLSDQWQAEAQRIADRKFTGLRVSVSAPHDIVIRYGVTALPTMFPEIEKMVLFVAEKIASAPWESGELRIEFTVYRGGHPNEDYAFSMNTATCRNALRLAEPERRGYILQNGTLAIRSGTEWSPTNLISLTDTTTSFEDLLEE